MLFRRFAGYVPLERVATVAVDIMAPHGLSDLFTMHVRRNPARVSVATYRERVAHKRYLERWPRVTVVLDEQALLRAA